MVAVELYLAQKEGLNIKSVCKHKYKPAPIWRWMMPLESFRILVVDDNADNLFLLQTVLEIEGYDVDTANNGSLALALIEASPPNLVLLDFMMPGLNGLDVTQRIRNNDKLAFIPILLVTAYEEVSAVEGLDNGANGLLRKPIDFDELLARVRELVRLKHKLI